MIAQQMRGADGVKIAVLRKGRASLEFFQAAAHAKRSPYKKWNMMNIIEQYLQRANEIIGNRSKDEERYDKEVLRWLRKGKNIRKAINKANKKYPSEALSIDESNVNEVANHYDYLLEHDNIIRKISH